MTTATVSPVALVVVSGRELPSLPLLSNQVRFFELRPDCDGGRSALRVSLLIIVIRVEHYSMSSRFSYGSYTPRDCADSSSIAASTA